MIKKSKLEESFLDSKKRAKQGQRGKSAEAQVEAALQALKSNFNWFDFDRLPDTRSAGRIMPARVSDFTMFAGGQSFSLEIKELTKGTRLGKADFPQLPRMARRAMAGVHSLLLVHLRELQLWVMIATVAMDANAKSWDILALGKDQTIPSAISISAEKAIQKLFIKETPQEELPKQEVPDATAQ